MLATHLLCIEWIHSTTECISVYPSMESIFIVYFGVDFFYQQINDEYIFYRLIILIVLIETVNFCSAYIACHIDRNSVAAVASARAHFARCMPRNVLTNCF